MTKQIVNLNDIPTLLIDSPSDIEGLELIDVRRAEEFHGELGHIKGAKLSTLGEDLELRLNSLKKETPLLFICRSGIRSAQATARAIALGFSDVYNLQGGMLAWNERQFPTETDLR